MATRSGARGAARGRRTRVGTEEEEASSGEEPCVGNANARDVRVARRRRVRRRTDRDAHLSVERQQTGARGPAVRTLSEEEEAVRQAEAALEIARTCVDDPAFLTTSDEENASGPEGLHCEPLTLEAEEEMRRLSELRAREQAAFDADLRAREQAAFDAELLAREQAALTQT